LHNPIHACATRGKTLSLSNHDNSRNALTAASDHVCDRIDFGVNVVTAKPVFDVASGMNSPGLVENRTSNAGKANYVRGLANAPSCCQHLFYQTRR
jgi:hypothetical protein